MAADDGLYNPKSLLQNKILFCSFCKSHTIKLFAKIELGNNCYHHFDFLRVLQRSMIFDVTEFGELTNKS